ncbi:hypothetical protein KGY73_06835 [bacterium]|nr:hypothetical protein [bacterium]
MRRISIITVISFAIFILGGMGLGHGDEKAVKSYWASSPLKIDGSYMDWSGASMKFEKSVMVDYAFMNDANNLYVLFIFKDKKYLSSIGQTGITIWINNQGKKKEKYGIKFMKEKIKPDKFISMYENQKGPLPEEKKKKMRKKPFYLVNKVNVINKKSKSKSSEKYFKPAVYRDKKQGNMYVYEFAIPLERVAEVAPGVGAQPGEKVKVGFEWGGMTKEMKAALMKRRAMASTQAKASKRTGDPTKTHSRQGSGGPGDFKEGRAKKYSFWMDLKLAQKAQK